MEQADQDLTGSKMGNQSGEKSCGGETGLTGLMTGETVTVVMDHPDWQSRCDHQIPCWNNKLAVEGDGSTHI